MARETAIGQLPRAEDLDTRGLEVTREALDDLLTVSPDLWREEFEGISAYLSEFGERLPPPLEAELQNAIAKVSAS